CHQLEYMSVSPHIAVMLNLYEEHLDHYGSMERYHNAKKNIYLHQRKSDRLIINYALVPVETEATVFSISNTDRDGDFFVGNSTLTCNMGPVYKIPADDIKLLGIHNHYNVAVAYLVANMCNVSDEDFTKALCTFNPLAHRLEFVAEVDGVRYYDDSISTACATAVEAVKSVPDPGTILIGGMDRGIDYAPLIQFLSSVDINVICMEASGNRIYSEIASAEFNSPERVFLVQHLEDAVKLANEITPKGKSCVLSPASASYGIFKNFEERGDVFKSLVNQL
ncbi:MAG: UDP-N-acetylmuramoyl-L-alanine--D-glutamate ligase, partial [Ruminococcus sp.]|nr:UDP-N-acetylmuramoyl-L-alanine--D-glutamate ligase [Ruminococcus sp.]